MARLISIISIALTLLSIVACSAGAPTMKVSSAAHKLVPPEFDAALALMKSGDTEAAEQAFVRLTEVYPRAAGPWTNLGILAARQQNYERAAKYFIAALQLDANNVVALNWMAFVTGKNGSYAGALDWYNKALAINEHYAPSHLNIAILYETVFKQPGPALAHYRRYHELTGGDNILVSAWIYELESANDLVAANVAQVNK